MLVTMGKTARSFYDNYEVLLYSIIVEVFFVQIGKLLLQKGEVFLVRSGFRSAYDEYLCFLNFFSILLGS